MKQLFQFVITYYLIAVCIGVMALTYIFLQRNPLSQTNRLKRQAKKEYLSHDYRKAFSTYQYLRDSMNEQHDAVSLNYANAAFLSVNLYPDSTSAGDTTDYSAISLSEYGKLSSSEDKVIASTAENQAGYAMVKSGDLFQKPPQSIDSALRGSLGHFRSALVRDPENDHARYNYELMKKLIGYPDAVVEQAKRLVAQQKYRQAAKYLERAMSRDKRLTLDEHKDLLNRIQQVAAIDSLKSNI